MRFPTINPGKMGLTGAVVVIGLTLGLLYIAYHLFTTETERVEATPSVISTEPVEPIPLPSSPNPEAPSSPAQPGSGP